MNGAIELAEWIHNGWRLYTQPLLSLLAPLPTRVEHGLSALQGCPVGGG